MRSSPDKNDAGGAHAAQDAPRARLGKYGRKAEVTLPPSRETTEPLAVVAREPVAKTGPESETLYDTLAGTIVSAHGVQGTLKVKPVTETAVSLFVPSGSKRVPIWIGSSGETGAVYQVVSAKRQEPKNIYLVHLDGVHDRTTAETLVGQSLFAPSARRVPLADEEYYVSDLIGLDVVDEQGVGLGKLTDVHRSPAHDIYETDQDILIPAVKEFVARVDLAARKLVVHDADRLRITETVERGPSEPEE